MVDGKKTVAFKIFYDALDIVEEKMAKKEEKSALEIWKQALENITPQVEVKSRRSVVLLSRCLLKLIRPVKERSL